MLIKPVLAPDGFTLPCGHIVLDTYAGIAVMIRHADRDRLGLPLHSENLIGMAEPTLIPDMPEDPDDDGQPLWGLLKPDSFVFGASAAVALTKAGDNDQLLADTNRVLSERYLRVFPDSPFVGDDQAIRDDILFLAICATLGGAALPGETGGSLTARYLKFRDRNPQHTVRDAIRIYVAQYVAAGELEGKDKMQLAHEFNAVLDNAARSWGNEITFRPQQTGGPQN